MTFAGRTALVTGGGQGIGRALVRALANDGVRVCVADLSPSLAQEAAEEVDGIAVSGDLRDSGTITRIVQEAEAALGQIDILVSNAGFALGALDGPTSAPDQQWQDSWDLHVMAHLRAARLVLPRMVARGEGWLVNVASAAGLLSQIGDAPYSASKHAAVSLAQSLAIEHGDSGIHVSVVCPLFVATPLLGYDADSPVDRPNDRVLTAAEVAASVMDGLRKDRFLILPHEEAGLFFRRRAEDMDRWIDGMRRLHRQAFADGTLTDFGELHRKI